MEPASSVDLKSATKRPKYLNVHSSELNLTLKLQLLHFPPFTPPVTFSHFILRKEQKSLSVTCWVSQEGPIAAKLGHMWHQLISTKPTFGNFFHSWIELTFSGKNSLMKFRHLRNKSFGKKIELKKFLTWVTWANAIIFWIRKPVNCNFWGPHSTVDSILARGPGFDSRRSQDFFRYNFSENSWCRRDLSTAFTA